MTVSVEKPFYLQMGAPIVSDLGLFLDFTKLINRFYLELSRKHNSRST